MSAEHWCKREAVGVSPSGMKVTAVCGYQENHQGPCSWARDSGEQMKPKTEWTAESREFWQAVFTATLTGLHAKGDVVPGGVGDFFVMACKQAAISADLAMAYWNTRFDEGENQG